MPPRIIYLLLAAVLLVGCRTGRNYPDTTGPRHAGKPAGGGSVSRYARTQRTATAATIRIGASNLRVYSTHLSTIFDIRTSARRDQLRAILADAAKYPRVVIGGDMNSSVVGRLARDMSYAWPTERGPQTTRGGRWDHIFFKGLATPGEAAGTVRKIRGASDHVPVWTIAIPGNLATRRTLTNSNQDRRQ